MKKILLSAIGVGLLSLASCSSEEAPKPTPSEGQQVLTIRVDDATRRVIDDSQAANDVKFVRVLIHEFDVVWEGYDCYKKTPISKIIPWTGESVVWNLTNDNITLTKGTKYYITAIAYEAATDYIIQGTDDEYGGINLAGESNFCPFLDNDGIQVPAELEYKGSSKAAEIFAGETTITADYDLNLSLTLTRQVAGVFFYVKNIPYVEEMATASTVTLDLVAPNLDNLPNVAVFGNYAAELPVINSCTKSSTLGNTLISVNLKKWFSAFENTQNGVIDDANWTGDSNAYNTGEVFGSTFFLPFAKGTNPTLQLQLKVDNTVKFTWDVKMNSLQTGNIYTYDSTNWVWESVDAGDTDNTHYNLYRNHLYTIGGRTGAPADDDPVSLYWNIPVQTLSLGVSNAWDQVQVGSVDEQGNRND